MKRTAIFTSIGVLVLATSLTNANAGLIYLTSAGTPQDTSSVSDFVTSNGLSPTMIGLGITATFANGFSQTLSWAPQTSGLAPCFGISTTGGVVGTGWSICGTGNTSAMLWQFTGGTNAITSLQFDGIPSNIGFDRTLPSPGTGGSAAGQDFLPDLNGDGFADNPDWIVTYSRQILLNGAAAVGDVWGSLSVNFGASGYSGNFSFLQDTDSFVPIATPRPLPEPPTIALLGLWLAGLGLSRHKKA